jgi:hypothetical protein
MSYSSLSIQEQSCNFVSSIEDKTRVLSKALSDFIWFLMCLSPVEGNTAFYCKRACLGTSQSLPLWLYQVSYELQLFHWLIFILSEFAPHSAQVCNRDCNK